MTLIIATIGPGYATLLADRRLTSDGRLVDDDYGKIGHLLTASSSMLYAFSGVARVGSFETRRWIGDTLLRLSGEGFVDHEPLLHHLAIRATDRFSSDGQLSTLADRRLTIAFAGFMGNGDAAFGLVSNFETIADDSDPKSVASGKFEYSYLRATRRTNEASAAFVYGNYAGLKSNQIKALAALRRSGKPLAAVRGTSVRVLHELAEDSASRGTIGKRYVFGSLPEPAGRVPEPPSSYYGSDIQTDTLWGLDVVSVMPWGTSFVRDVSIRAEGSIVRYSDRPRNSPCPCGSGRKFKHCHGR